MENNEKKKQDDFERLKGNMREKRKNKQLAHRKVVSRQISKSFMAGLKEKAVKNLTDVGFFNDSFKTDVLDNDVVPWLQE
jgi:hypothetical protein